MKTIAEELILSYHVKEDLLDFGTAIEFSKTHQHQVFTDLL